MHQKWDVERSTIVSNKNDIQNLFVVSSSNIASWGVVIAKTGTGTRFSCWRCWPTVGVSTYIMRPPNWKWIFFSYSLTLRYEEMLQWKLELEVTCSANCERQPATSIKIINLLTNCYIIDYNSFSILPIDNLAS